jgi:hypothetical protein
VSRALLFDHGTGTAVEGSMTEKMLARADGGVTQNLDFSSAVIFHV